MIEGVLARRVLRGNMPVEPLAGVVVALSKLYLGKLPGGAETRLSLLTMRFEKTGNGTGTGCSGLAVVDDMDDDKDRGLTPKFSYVAPLMTLTIYIGIGKTKNLKVPQMTW